MSALDNDDEGVLNTSPSAFDDDVEDSALNSKISKISSKAYSDPVADKLLAIYDGLNLEDNDILKFGILVAPVATIMFFYMFVSSSTSCLIAFSAFIVSITFLVIAVVMLCDILKKDIGPRAM